METILRQLAQASSEHPVFVGLLLLFVIASSGVHAVHLAAHLLLACSEFLRQQIVHAQPLGKRFQSEAEAWRIEVVEVFRFGSMPHNQINEQLQQYNIEEGEVARVLQEVAAIHRKRLSREEAPDSIAADNPSSRDANREAER